MSFACSSAMCRISWTRAAESGEVGVTRPCMGIIKGLAKLMVVGDQGIVLLQKLGDLGLRRSYEMVNGLAVISSARHAESGRYPNAGHLLGAYSRRLLTRQVPSPRVISG